MKLEIRRAYNANGGKFYLLLDGKKISVDGGWCLDGVDAIFGQMFDMGANESRDIEIITIEEGVTWEIKEKKKEIEYPVYAEVINNGAIYVFIDEKAKGWCIKSRNTPFIGDNVGDTIQHIEHEGVFFDDFGYWKIISEKNVFKSEKLSENESW